VEAGAGAAGRSASVTMQMVSAEAAVICGGWRAAKSVSANFSLCPAGGVIRVARRIYVSNLTWRTSWQDLKDHFKQAGRGEPCAYLAAAFGCSSPILSCQDMHG
jgi:hypothetical protein